MSQDLKKKSMSAPSSPQKPRVVSRTTRSKSDAGQLPCVVHSCRPQLNQVLEPLQAKLVSLEKLEFISKGASSQVYGIEGTNIVVKRSKFNAALLEYIICNSFISEAMYSPAFMLYGLIAPPDPCSSDLWTVMRKGRPSREWLKFIQEKGSFYRAYYAELLLNNVLTTLMSLHAQGLVHCDIKPDNIVAVQPARKNYNLAFQLVDYGNSRFEHQLTQRRMCTISCRSPEECLGEEITSASDIWSLGVTLLIVLGMGDAFLSCKSESDLQKVHSELFADIKDHGFIYYRPLLTFGKVGAAVMDMLKKEPKARSTAQSLLLGCKTQTDCPSAFVSDATMSIPDFWECLVFCFDFLPYISEWSTLMMIGALFRSISPTNRGLIGDDDALLDLACILSFGDTFEEHQCRVMRSGRPKDKSERCQQILKLANHLDFAMPMNYIPKWSSSAKATLSKMWGMERKRATVVVAFLLACVCFPLSKLNDEFETTLMWVMFEACKHKCLVCLMSLKKVSFKPEFLRVHSRKSLLYLNDCLLHHNV